MKNSLIALLLVAAPLWAAAPIPPEQDARIRPLIREALVENPHMYEQLEALVKPLAQTP